MNINTSAPIVASHDITIAADVQTVWDVLTTTDRWPEWTAEIPRASLTGPLAVGAVFRWETAGLVISSAIGELEPLKRIGWSGKAGDILGIHVWTLTPTSAGTRVHTEESWEGPELPAPIHVVQAALDGSLVGWLSSLKTRAERA
jgi:uncharacterized protein YndB with AHSA1/START domain